VQVICSLNLEDKGFGKRTNTCYQECPVIMGTIYKAHIHVTNWVFLFAFGRGGEWGCKHDWLAVALISITVLHKKII